MSKASLAENKKKALDSVFSQIDKQFGKGSVMLFGQKEYSDIKVISTGSMAIDAALGCGGLPKGRVVEVFGPEASGKTTLTLHVLAEAQAAGCTCAFIDAEHAMDPQYAQALGLNIDDLIISQPDYGEQALEITEMLLRSGAVDVIVIDSVAALVPKAEIEGDMGDAHVGLQARLMSQALRKLTAIVHKSNAILIFINQIRHKIGGLPFASNETTTGGNALKFYASIRIDIRRSTQIKNGEEIIGNNVKVKIVKNKVAPPFRKAEFDIMYGEGISKVGEIIDIGVAQNIIKKSGSWFSYGDTKLGQGRDAVKALLKDNIELAEELEEKVFNSFKVDGVSKAILADKED